jgi:two-component system, chemotaxis family, chemotaxis protein CheY
VRHSYFNCLLSAREGSHCSLVKERIMGKKILVVDDSATVRQQVGLPLTEAGFEVVEAVDGIDGIEKVNAVSDIALIICDVNMPRMNGLEMLEKVRADVRSAAIPILMLTTEGQPNLVERAKKAGAKGWIVKPFKAELLVAATKKLTRAA